MDPDSLRGLLYEGNNRNGVERAPILRGTWMRLGCVYPRPSDGRLVQLRLRDRWAIIGFEPEFTRRYAVLRAADAAETTEAIILLCCDDRGLLPDVAGLIAAMAAWVLGGAEAPARPASRAEPPSLQAYCRARAADF